MNAPARKPNQAKRQTWWRRLWIALGVVLAACCVCVGVIAIADGSGVLNTPTPAAAAQRIDSDGTVAALISYTQTAAAQIPITGPTETPTLLPTETPVASVTNTPTASASSVPSKTPAPTITKTAIPTFTRPPTRTAIPTITRAPVLPTVDLPQGITAICNDGSYSYSQHRRGTCSHHGGVKEWINRPPN